MGVKKARLGDEPGCVLMRLGTNSRVDYAPMGETLILIRNRFGCCLLK
jgi:hypothetical protein